MPCKQAKWALHFKARVLGIHQRIYEAQNGIFDFTVTPPYGCFFPPEIYHKLIYGFEDLKYNNG